MRTPQIVSGLVLTGFLVVAPSMEGPLSVNAHAGSSPAAAEPGQTVTCQGFETHEKSPGITFEPQDVDVTVKTVFNPCLSTDPSITGAETEFHTVLQDASCQGPLHTGQDETEISWNNGHTSTFTYDRTITHVGGTDVVTERGEITHGQFTGHSAVKTVVVPNGALADCLNERGVERTYGTVTLEIAPA